MTLISPSELEVLDEAAFEAELGRVTEATAQDRQWLEDFDLKVYETDDDILADFYTGRLAEVRRGAGYIAIDRLRLWEPSRSDAAHPFHYSPPYVRKGVEKVVEHIGAHYQADMGEHRYLSLTSAGRSSRYQAGIQRRPDSMTIKTEGLLSSHQALIAFDLDGCGLMEESDDGTLVRINPNPDIGIYRPKLVRDSRDVIQGVLDDLLGKEAINYVEEMKNTARHGFHVCVNPDALV